jgi:hypothetical protein
MPYVYENSPVSVLARVPPRWGSPREQEDEGGPRAQQRHRRAERHEPQRGIGEKGNANTPRTLPTLNAAASPSSGAGGHDQEREREVIEQRGMPR